MQLLPKMFASRTSCLRAALWLLLVPWLLIASQPAGADRLLYADHPLAGKVWDMKQRRMLDESSLLARMADAEVLLLGETHDNPQHHALQLKLLQARLDSGARPALLLEQIDRERQSALDAALEKSPQEAALAAVAGLLKGWDWQFYKPLVAAGWERKLPVYAANFSRDQARAVIRNGFAAMDAAELKRLAVESAWGDGQQRFLTRIIEDSHCGQVDQAMRDGLVRGQRLRDAVLADVAAAAASRGQGVVGIVGRGHVRRDIGMPLYLAARYPQLRVFSIGFVEVSQGQDAAEAYEQERVADEVPYDVVWFTARTERQDPCASFGKKP